MTVASLLHLCGGALTLAVGVMLLVVGSLVVGGVITLGGGAWVGWALHRG